MSLMLVATLALAQYQYETTVNEQIGPGMVHRRIVVATEPWQIHVIEVDLRHPYVALESVKAKDLLIGRETTSRMARRRQDEGHRVVAAINADFFEADGSPVNLQIRNGEILRTPIARTVVGFYDRAKPIWGRLQFSGCVVKGSRRAAILNINSRHTSDDLVLYNRYFGVRTLTDSTRCEALLHPLQEWQVNDTLTCMIDSIANGNMAIPDNHAVLSGHGLSGAFVRNNILKGDTVKLWLGLPPSTAAIREMIGGLPQIVVNGREQVSNAQQLEGGSDSFTNTRHPRTAVGFNADSSSLFLVTVDGRQPAVSSGMSLQELAGFLIHIGVHNGINLDGGGSTTMVINDTVMNSPSDAAGERAVANALLLISTAPKGTVVRLNLQPKSARLLTGQSLTLSAKGMDQYCNVIALEPAQCSFSCPSALGEVESDGTFTAGRAESDGFVLFRYGALTDSVSLRVRSIAEFGISPKRPLATKARSVSFLATVKDRDGREHYPDITWSCLDPAIGSIDSLGLFHAIKSGTARIVASALGHQDTARVTVKKLKRW
jgi:hypothetical protein